MRVRILVLCLFLLMPAFVVNAAEEPAAGTSEEPQAVSSCSKNICQDEEVVVSPSAKPPVSCKPGRIIPPEQCPKCQVVGGKYTGAGVVTYKDVSGKVTKTISKCEPNYAKRSDRISDALQSENPEEALRIEEARNLLEEGVASGQLPKEIADAFTPAQLSSFQEELKADPRSAAEKIGALMYGDGQEKLAAAQSLGVTSEQLDNLGKLAVRLTPPDDTRESAVNTFQNTLSGYQPSISTGFPITRASGELPGGRFGEMFKKWEEQYGLPPGYLAGLAKVESSGNPVVCASQSSACGLFQYTSGTWKIDSARINGGVPLPLSARFDPEISARVTAASVAYYKQQYGSLIYGSGMDEKAAFYSLHNLGEGGGQRFMRAFAANPHTPVNRVLTPIEIRNNPGLYGNGSISLAQAQANMLAKMSGSTAFTGSVPGGGQLGYSPFANVSPFVSGPSGSSAPVGTSLQNLFRGGGNSPRPSAPSGGATVPQPVQGGSVAPPPGQTGPTPGSSPAQQLIDALNPASQTPQTLSPVEAVATIIAQPSGITRGRSVIVSWSTVGMSTNSPCTVTLLAGTTTSVVGQGNEGTRTIETSTTSASGAWDFTLKCTAAINGASVERSTSVPVQ